MQDIINHPEYRWDWRSVSYNPNLCIDCIIKHPDNNWSWNYIMMFTTVDLELLLEYLPDDVEINVYKDSKYIMKIINKYPNKKWDWNTLSSCSMITIHDIQSNPHIPWNWENICTKNDFSLDQELYVNNMISGLLITTILEVHMNHHLLSHHTSIDWILCNVYIMSQVMSYI